MSREELQKAVETAEAWMLQWEDDFVEDSDLDYDNEAEREAIQAFNKIISHMKKELAPPPDDCPHAAPFRYCNGCKVSPCPIGLE